MIETKRIQPEQPSLLLTADIVYGHRIEFCGAQYLPLKLSLIKPRVHFHYDPPSAPPTIVFLCGGGWSETDHNVWLPELAWFAKRGYAVASVQYPVTRNSRYPENLERIQEAIDFLRAHAEEFKIDMSRFAVMGESAGAYLALMTASKGEADAAVAFYPPISPGALLDEAGGTVLDLPSDSRNFASVLDSITPKMPPTLLLHGTVDELVPLSHSERIHARLQEQGIDSRLIVVEDANHADYRFFQPEIMDEILAFLNQKIGR